MTDGYDQSVWQRLSYHLAVIANCHGAKRKPSDFDEYHKARSKITLTGEQATRALRSMFVKGNK